MDLTTQVAVTAIIRRQFNGVRKYLLLQRAASKKLWPNLWTLPGGHVDTQDYEGVEANAENIRYGVLENALRREVWEEAGINIKNIEFLTSMFFQHKENMLVMSMLADQYGDGEVKINSESQDFGWFDVLQVQELATIDGIYEEISAAEYGSFNFPSYSYNDHFYRARAAKEKFLQLIKTGETTI